MAIAPSSFGTLAEGLLVGNAGDGSSSVFSSGGAFLGKVLGANGQPLAIDGLWALTPGNDGSGGSSSLLYFTAGPDEGTHGVLGVLTPVPEPSSAAFLLGGLALVIARRAQL